MRIQSLGHAVLKVRSLARAEAFYTGVLGLPVAARNAELGMVFFTLGNHHDFAVKEMGDDAPLADPKSVGLFHLAFKVGDTVEELRAAKELLLARNIEIDRIRDHNVSYSIYLNDPDGNQIELYVDVSDAWKKEPSLVASAKPLEL